MKSLLRDFLSLVAFAFVVYLFIQVFVLPKINGGTVIYPTQPAIYQPTQPVQPVMVEPTWTPFYQIISVPPTAEPTLNPDHLRTGITPGTVGNHDTGRTDNRTP